MPQTQWIDDITPPTTQWIDDEPSSGYGLSTSGMSYLGDLGIGIGRGIAGLGSAGLGWLDILTSPIPDDTPFTMGRGISIAQKKLSDFDKYLASFQTPESRASEQQLGRAQGFGESADVLMRNPGLIGTTLAQSAPSMLGGMGLARGAVSVLPKLSPWLAGSLGEAAIGAGQQAADIREETGDLTPGQALGAIGSGGLTGLISAGSGKAAQKLGLPDIDAMLADPTRTGVRRIPALLGGGLIEGGFEEPLQSGQEKAAFNLATGKPIGQGVPSAMTMGALSGFIPGSTLPMFGRRPPPTGNPPMWDETPLDIEGPEVGPYGTGEGQTEFPFMNKPHVDAATFAAMRNQAPPIDASGQGLLFGEQEGINLDITSPNVIPEGSSLSSNQQVVTITNPATFKFWQSKGYVPVPGLTSEPDAAGRRYPQMVRADVAALFVGKGTGGPTPIGATPPGAEPELTQLTGQGPLRGTAVSGEQPIVVPNEVADRRGYTERMAKNGFTGVRGATRTVFTRFVKEDKGEVDFQVIIDRLRQLLGRDPTQAEVEQEAFKTGTNEAPIGPGGVAEFPNPNRIPQINENLISLTNQLHRTMDPDVRRQLLDNIQALQAQRKKLREYGGFEPPQEGEPIPLMTDEQYNQPPIPNPAGIPGLESANQPPAPPATFAPDSIGANLPGLFQGPPPIPPSGRVPDRRLFIEEADPTVDRAIPPTMGQQDIPFLRAMQRETPLDMAQVERQDMLDAPAVEEADLLARTPMREPVQQSMIPEFQDAEIGDWMRDQGIDPAGRGGPIIPEEQEMKVPGVKEGNTGLANVAIGGADPRVLDVLGSSLYSRARPVTAMKELLQNAWDELRQTGSKAPVKVVTNSRAQIPNSTKEGMSLTVRDYGRGLTLDQIYTVLTDLGKTGKAGIESASGGFGFAKASPFLGGAYVRVTSTVDTKKGRRRYIFEGTPTELKNQVKGVPINKFKAGRYTVGFSDDIAVKREVPTGLEISVWYPDDIPGFYDASRFAKDMTQGSSNIPSGIELVDESITSHTRLKMIEEWLDEHPSTSERNQQFGTYNTFRSASNKISPMTSQPTLMDKIVTLGAEVDIRYDVDPNREASDYTLYMMNKGMFQGTQEGTYGEQTPNVPSSIVADIRATVEEGHPQYPYTANREQLSDDVKAAIDKWVRDNIVSGVTRKRVQKIQRKYDSIAKSNSAEHGMHFYDEGKRFTQQEKDYLDNHPEYNYLVAALQIVHEDILAIADTLGWRPAGWDIRSTWTKPSERLKKTGILYQGPDRDGKTTLGIHIPRPDDMNDSAILYNIMESMHLAIRDNPDASVDMLVTSLVSTVAHEIAHIPGGSHDKGHSYRDADLRSKLGEIKSNRLFRDLREALDDGQGRIKREIRDVLRLYAETRKRPSSEPDDLLSTGVSVTGRQNPNVGAQGNVAGTGAGQGGPRTLRQRMGIGQGTQPGQVFDPVRWAKEKTGWGMGRIPPAKNEEYNVLREMLAVPTSATTTGDVSYIGRQGLSTVFTRQFPRAVWDSLRAANYETYRKITRDLENNKIHKRSIDLATGKQLPSYAEKAKLKLLRPASEAGPRAEGASSRWLEVGIGNDPFSKIWRSTVGKPIRMTNRMFITFFNSWKTNRMEFLSDKAEKMSLKAQQGKYVMEGLLPRKFNQADAENLNPYQNILRAREIADFLNTATGQAPLKTHLLPYKGAEVSLEAASKALSMGLFSPGLMASRVRMLNPSTYIMATPFVRKQYMHAALSAGAAWFAFTAIIKAVAGDDAEVGDDPLSADFGKVRIGNTRLDVGGGFLQFLVAYSRAWTGEYASSATGQHHKFGSGFQAPTQAEYGERFLANKLNPVAKFVYDWATASEYKPLHVYDRAVQMFIPLAIQDIWEILHEDPDLFPADVNMPLLVGAAAQLGAGTQTYSKGESVAKFVDPENDWLIKGGGIRDLMPWNWNPEEEY